MKTFTCLLLLIAALAVAPASHARADKSMLGEALPELALDYIRETPELAGKPMVLEFWATWCGPCIKGIPHLNQLYSKYKGQGLVIIGVTKEKKSVVTKFLKKTPMEYFPALDPGGKLNQKFQITAIPHAVLVDRSGIVVWEGHPMRLTHREIAKVLEE